MPIEITIKDEVLVRGRGAEAEAEAANKAARYIAAALGGRIVDSDTNSFTYRERIASDK